MNHIAKNTPLQHLAVWVLATVTMLIGTACSSSPKTDATAAPATADNEGYVTMQALPVTADDSNSSWYLLKPDATYVGGMPVNGLPSEMFNNRFVSTNTNGECYVYSAEKTVTPLNKEPFTAITDFRTGFAYAARPGRPLMVVNQNGAVARLLSDDIKQILLWPNNPDCILYEKSDGKSGLLRPNGDPIIEVDEETGIGPLADDRILTMSPEPRQLSIYDSTGKLIKTFPAGAEPYGENFADGWLGILNPDSTSCFYDIDANVALRLPDNYVAMRRIGNVAMVQNINTEVAALADVKTGRFLVTDINSSYIFKDNDQWRIMVTRTLDDNIIEVYDDNAKLLKTLPWSAQNVYPMTNMMAITTKNSTTENTRFAIYDPTTGLKISPQDAEYANCSYGQYSSVTNPRFPQNSPEIILYGISTDGWTIDNYLYNKECTPKAILDESLTPQQVFDLYNEGRRSITLADSSENEYTLVFDAMPVIHTTQTKTRQLGWFKHSYEEDVYDWNPNARLSAIFSLFDTTPDHPATMLKALKSEIESRGFVGYYDKQYMFSSNNTHVCTLPTTNGFYIMVAFNRPNYERLLDTDFTDPEIANIDYTN